MKTVRITLSDAQAAELDRAAASGGFPSPSDLVLAAIADFVTEPVAYDRDALQRDIAEHRAAKERGDTGLTADAARDWLRAARPA
jgi:Arc/MetJ-type ribon-helix-helix transcriptional regulator